MNFPAATFTASRAELLGAASMFGVTEVARSVCRSAERTIGVLAVTRDRMRLIDGWVGPVGFVGHASSPDPTAAVRGSVCDRERAPEMIGELTVALVGELPHHPARAVTTLIPLPELRPASVPAALDWVVVIVSSAGPRDPPRLRVVAGADGLLVGEATAVDQFVVLRPADPECLRDVLAGPVGDAARSLRDLRLGG